MLTTEELLSAAIEACKVSIAINIARLIVETEDEETASNCRTSRSTRT